MRQGHPLTALAAIVALCGYCALALTPLPSLAETTVGSGRSARESRSAAPLQAIKLEGHMDLVVRQGTTPSVQVQADDSLLPLLQTELEPGPSGATLRVRWQPGATVRTRSKVVVSVVTPTLQAISLTGAGNLHLHAFETPALKVLLSGSGHAQLEALQTADLSLRIAGSGDVQASGNSTALAVSMAGSGNLELSALKADTVSLHIAGSGDAAVRAEQTLAISSAGSGDVVYSGAAVVQSRMAGSGRVTRR